MLALFVTSTLDGWANLYHFAMDAAPEPHHQPVRESAFPGPLVRLPRAPSTLTLTPNLALTPALTPNPHPGQIYYVLFVIIGVFFLCNIFVGVVIDQFQVS